MLNNPSFGYYNVIISIINISHSKNTVLITKNSQYYNVKCKVFIWSYISSYHKTCYGKPAGLFTLFKPL